MDTILIVDDDPVLLGFLETSLAGFRNHFEVVTAGDGFDAVAVLRERPVALVVTDVVMPGFDGFALLAYINEHHPAVPCFVMTAFETPETQEMLSLDIVRFFKKPIAPDNLGTEIVKTLTETSPRGMVSGVAVTSFLQMIEMEKKTCLFEVILPDREKGLFYFENGLLCDVVCGERRGQEAAFAFLTDQRAQFKFKSFPRKKIAKRIKLSVKALIEEKIKADLASKGSAQQLADQFTEKLNLPGKYMSSRSGNGYMTVLKLSKSGLVFEQDQIQPFALEEALDIEFTLDDGRESLIRKSTRVVAAQKNQVSVKFNSRDHYDALGPYLLYRRLGFDIIFELPA